MGNRITRTPSHLLFNAEQILDRSLGQQVCSLTDASPSTESSCGSSCTLIAMPSVTIFDQKVNIRVQWLPSHAEVTLQAWTYQKWRGKDTLFASYGQFIANQNGDIDLDRHPSLRGTYTGVDSMGLLWSLGPLPGHPKNVRMIVKDVQQPVVINVALFSGHIALNESSIAMKTITPLCISTITRLPKARDVRRIEIKEGRIRGTLFLPPGEGPFLGVIDMYGAGGGITEIRAALLATKGFVALALAFVKYQDLPQSPLDVSLDYFEEAAHWLSSHPAVVPGGIGIVGVSAGATFAMCMASLCPQIKAVVNINGSPFSWFDLFHQGKLFLKGKFPTLIKSEEKGGVITVPVEYVQDDFIPVWKHSAHVLCLCSEDDNQVPYQWQLGLRDAYPDDKRHLIHVVVYPGAGHLLEPPYTPHCPSCFSPGFNDVGAWGGSPLPHAIAQADAWPRAVAFLETILSQGTGMAGKPFD